MPFTLKSPFGSTPSLLTHPPIWRVYATLALTLCWKACKLSLAIAALITLPLLAKTGSSDKCPLPVRPDAYGYQVTRDTDQLGQKWIYFYYKLQVGDQVLTRKVDQFDAKDMIRAVKEAEKWSVCVEQKLKKTPKTAATLPRTSY